MKIVDFKYKIMTKYMYIVVPYWPGFGLTLPKTQMSNICLTILIDFNSFLSYDSELSAPSVRGDEC